jgi:cytochrome oxidase Cu insertion factor (SCO1/SenC/PrrC family)
MFRQVVAALTVVLLGVGSAGGAPLDELAAALNLAPLYGAAAPPLALERLADGKVVALPALRGRPVLVYFWATW